MTAEDLSQLRFLKQEAQLINEQLDYLSEKMRGGDADCLDAYAGQCRLLFEKNREIDRKYAEVMSFIDSQSDTVLRQALTLRFVKGLTWRAVAMRIGGDNSEDGIRKLCMRLMEKSQGESA